MTDNAQAWTVYNSLMVDTASVYPVTDHIAHKVYILGRSILHKAHP